MKQWPILSILAGSMAMLGLASSYLWSDDGRDGQGPRWSPRPSVVQKEKDGRDVAAVRKDGDADRSRQKAELDATLRQLREKAAQTEAMLRQLEEKSQQEMMHRPPPVREQIQLRQDKPMPVVIRFNHISAGSFVNTLEQLARNPKVAEAMKDVPWAVNGEANAVVVILPPAAAETLIDLARQLDQPSQYHKPVQREGFKFTLPLPPGAFGPGQMPGMPGGKCPMKPGSECPMTGKLCPMKPGNPCQMKPDSTCPMPGGMKVMPGVQHEEMKVIISEQGERGEHGNIMRPPAGPMHGDMKVAPKSAPMPPAAQRRVDPRISEAMELLEAALKNQNNPRLTDIVKFLDSLLKDQAGQEHEKAEGRHDADSDKFQNKGRFRIQLKDDDDD